ncbi:hypothetical protein BS17DRAFT_212555 [Gyrodon lividus]|nr:hypothetical protein BS17DRAFT_212555 [Gyrodon lividus]
MALTRSSHLTGEEVDNILEWLNGLDCTGKHEYSCALRQAGTCTWLSETEIYQSWRRGDTSFLWLDGKPGLGKSILASSVIDNLEHTRSNGEVLAFFYCDFCNEQYTSAAAVMRSLLTQLLHLANIDDVDCRDAVFELIECKAIGAAPPNDLRLLIDLVRCAAKLHQRPLIVIDALDECKDVEKLLNVLEELNDGHIRLFVTSRPQQVIRERLSDLPSISLQEMTSAISADMERHNTKELDSHRSIILEAGVKEEIRSALLEVADGTFRWTQCQIDALSHCTSVEQIQTILESLPIGLDETYERILVMIDGKEFEWRLIRSALVWLVASLRPLRLSDIIEALKIDLEKQTFNDDIGPMNGTVLLDACRSLLTYNEETGTVTLSHFSVKEYLTGELIRTKLSRYYIDLRDAHEQLARVCIQYMFQERRHFRKPVDDKSASVCVIPSTGMSSDDSDDAESSSLEEESSDTRRLSRSLLRYALSNGFGHLAHLGPGHDLVLDDLITIKADIRQHPAKWKNIRNMFLTDRDSFTLHWSHLKHDFMCYTFVCFASVPLLERFLDRAAQMPQDGTNPLLYAAYFNKTQHARILLSRGASINNIGWIVDRSRQALPLEVAVERWHGELVDLFLEAGSQVPERLFDITLCPDERIPLRIVRSLLQTNEFFRVGNRVPGRAITT